MSRRTPTTAPENLEAHGAHLDGSLIIRGAGRRPSNRCRLAAERPRVSSDRLLIDDLQHARAAHPLECRDQAHVPDLQRLQPRRSARECRGRRWWPRKHPSPAGQVLDAQLPALDLAPLLPVVSADRERRRSALRRQHRSGRALYFILQDERARIPRPTACRRPARSPRRQLGPPRAEPTRPAPAPNRRTPPPSRTRPPPLPVAPCSISHQCWKDADRRRHAPRHRRQHARQPRGAPRQARALTYDGARELMFTARERRSAGSGSGRRLPVSARPALTGVLVALRPGGLAADGRRYRSSLGTPTRQGRVARPCRPRPDPPAAKRRWGARSTNGISYLI